MYHVPGLAGFTAGDAPGPSSPSTPEYSAPTWWEAPLGQVSQAAADWVDSSIKGVPVYGGAPAYPAGTPGYQFYNAPDSLTVTVPEKAGMSTGAKLALGYAAAALLAAKVMGAI